MINHGERSNYEGWRFPPYSDDPKLVGHARKIASSLGLSVASVLLALTIQGCRDTDSVPHSPLTPEVVADMKETDMLNDWRNQLWAANPDEETQAVLPDQEPIQEP